MPCHRCGVRQTDPERGASPWRRGVREDRQVLICPACQHAHDLNLDACPSCGSTALIRRLGDIECRTCGTTRPARSDTPHHPPPSTLPAEVEAAITRILHRP